MPKYKKLDFYSQPRQRFAILHSAKPLAALLGGFIASVLLAIGLSLIFYFGTYIPVGIFLIVLGSSGLSSAFFMKVPRDFFNKCTLAIGSCIGIPAGACAGFFIGGMFFPAIGNILGAIIGIAVGAVLGPIVSSIIANTFDMLNLTDPGGIVIADRFSGAGTLLGLALGAGIGFFFTPIGPILGMLAGAAILTSLGAIIGGIYGTLDPFFNENNHATELRTAILPRVKALKPGIDERPQNYPGSERIIKIIDKQPSLEHAEYDQIHYQVPGIAPQEMLIPRPS